MGLGANLGDRRSALAFAVRRLAEALSALRVSPLYETAPVGGPPQGDFLNAAAVGATRLPARALLSYLHRVESEAGRRRPEAPNAPRPLDLDLLLYGDASIRLPDLTVPHPRLASRRFVLRPLADLAPDRRVVSLGATVAELLAALGAETAADRATPAGRLS